LANKSATNNSSTDQPHQRIDRQISGSLISMRPARKPRVEANKWPGNESALLETAIIESAGELPEKE
jgi:hypothetical protein